jgi:hypothetical protein
MSDLKKCVQELLKLSDDDVKKVKAVIDLLYVAQDLEEKPIDGRFFVTGEYVFFIAKNRVMRGYICERNETAKAGFEYGITEEKDGAHWWRGRDELYSTKEEAEKSLKG